MKVRVKLFRPTIATIIATIVKTIVAILNILYHAYVQSFYSLSNSVSVSWKPTAMRSHIPVLPDWGFFFF